MPPLTLSWDMSNRDLESFLSPSILRTNLIVVALYIAAFELLHDSIVERLRDFYARPSDTTSKPVQPMMAMHKTGKADSTNCSIQIRFRR
jgi:hypothetical protein